ncbi:MAG TPA: helix-turn-helix domain-containing protein, partial [Roseimicrobium sp.]|nr:helix-turn-helix domain-containing protein [Roseimicrobium sp.]
LPDFRVESQLRKLSEPPALMISGGLDESISAFERELISTTLDRHGYSLGKAAEALKVSRHALRYRMQRLNIQGAPGDSAEDDSSEEKEAPGARNR